MQEKLTTEEIRKIYQIVRAFSEGLIVNPSEDWELDYHDERIADMEGLGKILKKLEGLLPREEFERINKNVLRRKYDTFNNEIDEGIYGKIERGFSERRTVEIGYFGMNSARVIKRKIDIYHKTRKYVIAYCHLRNAIRKFRTSRIASASLTAKTYAIPEGFDKGSY